MSWTFRNQLNATLIMIGGSRVVQTEKPDTLLAVVIASLHIADKKIMESFKIFESTLERYDIMYYFSMLCDVPIHFSCVAPMYSYKPAWGRDVLVYFCFKSFAFI